MDEDLGLPCVLIRCEASKGKLYVWLAHHWDENEEANIRDGRTLIARAPNKTCRALRDLMQQQENQHAN